MLESEQKELKAEIKSVIVYQQGVQITKLGSIHLTRGEHLISIRGLPESLDKESIRVKGIGNGKIINISVEFNSKKEYRTELYKNINEEKERLEKEIKKGEIELERINEQIAKFKSTEDEFYDNWAKAFAFGEVELSNFIDFNEKFNERVTSKTDSAEILEDKIKELLTEFQVIQNKIYNLGPVEEVHNFYDINININVVQEGDFKIEIRYTMNQAWWVPFYDVVLSEEKAKIAMMANVYNRTGVDWENIEVEISTASLKPIRLIKPNPMILEEYIPVYNSHKDSKKRMNGYGGDTLSSSYKAGLKEEEKMSFDEYAEAEDDDYDFEEEPIPEIEETYAEVSENIGVQSFKIPERIDIPSDKNPHPVNLTIQELETEKKYYWSVSNPSSAVIIQDTVVNGDLLLLAGNVKIYFQEEFLGETNIPVIAPKERFKLGTRISYDLKIDKKLIDRSKAKKAIKGRLKNYYDYKISIKNLNEATEDLTLYDKIPHSSSENIKVEIENISPEPYKKKLGVLTWKFNLKGIDEKTVNYKYVVDYKKGIQITPPLP